MAGVTTRPAVLLFVSAITLFAQGTPHENLNAVLWMQTAAEYRAAASGTYRAAEANLLRALNDANWTAAAEQSPPYKDLPPAIIADLDETVLDNSVFQARLTAKAKAFTDENWSEWVAEHSAGLVPGAREFLMFAAANGVVPFYITNRVCQPEKAEDPTVKVLRAHMLPFHASRLLCKTAGSDKAPRREQVTRTHRVLLLIGDDLNDFLALPLKVEARHKAIEAYRRHWGERWFMLPNPTYGSWERSVGLSVPVKFKALRQ